MTQIGVPFRPSRILIARRTGAAIHLNLSGIGCLLLVIIVVGCLACWARLVVTCAALLRAVDTSRNRVLASLTSGIR